MVGTPVAFLSAERFWQGQHFVWFITPVLAGPVALAQGPTSPHFVVDAMAAGALVIGFLGLRWLDRMSSERTSGMRAAPIAWWVYAVGALLVAYSAYFPDSIPRYATAAFPLFAAFAWRLGATRRIWVLPATVIAMALAQAALLLEVLGMIHLTAGPLIP